MAIFASALAIGVSFIAAMVPAINIPGHPGGQPQFPAPAGYVLPWPGGEIHATTQGEETSFTHNGTAAYAFDFDLIYDTVTAARGGKVVMVRENSNLGGCSRFYANSANYVVIDHGDGTSGLYLHLAYGGVTVEVGQMVVRGEAIALSGETGVTCAGSSLIPGPHLHFQVEQTEEGKYFTQSLPIAFDDLPGDNGVPKEGKSYVSGNYGPGKPQKIDLTPRWVPREFDPRAVPLYPDLVEAPLVPPTPVPATPTETPIPVDTPLIPDSTEPPTTDTPEPTPVPEDTATEVPTDVPAAPSDTPVPPPPSATPLPPTATYTPTPAPPPTDTPVPSPSDTPTP